MLERSEASQGGMGYLIYPPTLRFFVPIASVLQNDTTGPENEKTLEEWKERFIM